MSNDLTKLIVKAGEKVGSEYKLAQELGIPQSTLSNWKSGARKCTPPDRARIAGFAREDAIQELVRATIEGSKGKKRAQLEQVLGKLSHQTGAVLNTVLLAVVSLASGMVFFDIPRCIKRETV